MGSCFSGLAGIVVNPSRVTNKAYLCIDQHVSAALTVILADVLVTVFNRLYVIDTYWRHTTFSS